MTTESVMEKAVRLVDTGRVAFMAPRYTARVKGDSAVYFVTAFHDSLACTCPAGRYGRCSHSFAAMLAWQEEQEEAS